MEYRTLAVQAPIPDEHLKHPENLARYWNLHTLADHFRKLEEEAKKGKRVDVRPDTEEHVPKARVSRL